MRLRYQNALKRHRFPENISIERHEGTRDVYTRVGE